MLVVIWSGEIGPPLAMRAASRFLPSVSTVLSCVASLYNSMLRGRARPPAADVLRSNGFIAVIPAARHPELRGPVPGNTAKDACAGAAAAPRVALTK
ncbi:hypothetical protein DM77_1311 [Burkholderia mallei]|nr:hypothetical protein DM77_1311 [Burkholderia mallei]